MPEPSDSDAPLDAGEGSAPDPEAAEEASVDHDLIRRAQGGDEDAFADLVRRHEARAARVAWGMVANREDARDLAQEAFLRVFRNLDRFDFKHGFTTWLYRIVTNLAIDHLRRRRPAVSTTSPGEEATELDLPDGKAPAPSAGIEREETAALVRECIDRLPPLFRESMVLRELEGMSCKAIAEVVGATHVTVRWRLHRGRKLFQDEWERMMRHGISGPPSAESPDFRADGPGSANTPAASSVHPAVDEKAASERREP